MKHITLVKEPKLLPNCSVFHIYFHTENASPPLGSLVSIVSTDLSDRFSDSKLQMNIVKYSTRKFYFHSNQGSHPVLVSIFMPSPWRHEMSVYWRQVLYSRSFKPVVYLWVKMFPIKTPYIQGRFSFMMYE